MPVKYEPPHSFNNENSALVSNIEYVTPPLTRKGKRPDPDTPKQEEALAKAEVEKKEELADNVYVGGQAVQTSVVMNVSPEGIKKVLGKDKKRWEEVTKFVPRTRLMSENPDDILYEGEVWKYKPGLNTTYMTRWAQVTKREFKYYKDRYHSSQWLSKPLVVLSLPDIDKVVKAESPVDNLAKVGTKSTRIKHLFEILTKFQEENEEQCSKRLLERSMDKNEREKEFNRVQKLPGKIGWTNRQKEWEMGEIRLLFGFTAKEEHDKWMLLLHLLVEAVKS